MDALRRRAPPPDSVSPQHVRPAGAVNRREVFPGLFRGPVPVTCPSPVRCLSVVCRPAPADGLQGRGADGDGGRDPVRPAAVARCGAPVPPAGGRPPRRVRRACAAALSTPSARPVRPVRTTRSRFRSLRPTTLSELGLRGWTRRHQATFRHTVRSVARASIPVFDRAGTRSSRSLADGGANDGNRRESGRGARHRCPLRRRDPVCDRPPYRTTTPPGGHRLVAAPGPALPTGPPTAFPPVSGPRPARTGSGRHAHRCAARQKAGKAAPHPHRAPVTARPPLRTTECRAGVFSAEGDRSSPDPAGGTRTD